MAKKKGKARYRQSEGKHWIEVRVKDAKCLFDGIDPAPFRERDLDDHFVEYIYSAVREFSLSTPVKIIIYIEESEEKSLSSEAIREAIHSHLSYEIELQTNNIRRFAKRAQLFLFIGLFVLASCLGVSQKLLDPSSPGLSGILREGLVIFGWVSMWKPIELILFDWYPLLETLRYYKKLLMTDIEIHFGAKD